MVTGNYNGALSERYFREVDANQDQINSKRPFDENLIAQSKDYFRIGLTHSSNALEGNSLTESETKVVIEDGLTVAGKPLRDHDEALGHSEAYDYMVALTKSKAVSEEDIRKFHNLFYHRIDQVSAGPYRNSDAIITGSKFPLPKLQDIPTLMKEFITSLSKMR